MTTEKRPPDPRWYERIKVARIVREQSQKARADQRAASKRRKVSR